MRHCERPFSEELLSGYVDEVLTQGDDQRVRIHLEDCASCAALVRDMRENREVTMTTRFKTPDDDTWDEHPRGAASGLSFGLGWILFIIWAVGITGYCLWSLATGPDNLLAKLLIFSGLSAMGLLLLSVIIDRLKSLSTDRYTKVQK